MKPSHVSVAKLVRIAIAVHLGVLCARLEGAKMHDLPIHSQSLQKAVGPENLKAIADKTQDADVLLGLAQLAPAGHPVREEISRRVATAKPQYSPVVAVVAVMLDGADEGNVNRLIERDPENALGYYMRANLLYEAKRDAEALEAFRKAADCRELRLYEAATSAGLLRALDELKLKGRERLNALSWIATRVFNAGVVQIQPLHDNLSELTRKGDLRQRQEISDMLLILAGHLYRTNFNNRTYGERALQSAFRLKAEVAAAENSPRMHGYAAVTQALVSTVHSWPQITEGQDLQGVVPFVPSRVYWAFLLVDPAGPKSPEEKLELSAPARAEYERARKNEVEAAEALIEAAMENPDEIVGAYLKGVVAPKAGASDPWVSRDTYVERAMWRWPAVFKAAIRNEEAMDAVYKARHSDPRHQNLMRMMDITSSILSYAFKHENRLPDSLDVLFKEKYLQAPIEAKSLITGRAYVYVGANQKLPERQSDRFKFIMLYDDHEVDGKHQAVLAIPGGFEIAAEELKKRLEAQRK